MVWLFAALGTAAAPPPPQYEVYALSYGILPDFPVASLVAGADRSRRMDIQLMIWLLKGPGGRNILIDSGFHRRKHLDRWRPRDFLPPTEAIGRAGLKPEQITDIILTHMHWDHAGGIDLFPNARVWIQREEFQYYTGTACQAGGAAGGIDSEDVLELVRLNTLGRVGWVEGDGRAILPGVRCYTGGRHTFASQYVAVSAGDEVVVIASDNAYLYENLERGLPIAQTLDPESNLRAQARMRQLASRPELILPGHDPEVFARFPSIIPGLARIR